MKNKALIITVVFLFLVVNTSYYWEAKLGILSFPAFAVIAIVFLILVIISIRQIYIIIREKFQVKHRIMSISVSLPLLLLIIYKPNGLIDFDKLEGKDLLIAQAEGAANCVTTFKLKENNKFVERSICFGVSEIKGYYKIKNDTVFFYDVQLSKSESEYFKYAIIKSSNYQNGNKLGSLVRHKANNDTLPRQLTITINKLKK